MILALISCSDDEGVISVQDQKQLDEAARKLDAQMPSARAERMKKAEQE